jgi:hypothetical protein
MFELPSSEMFCFKSTCMPGICLSISGVLPEAERIVLLIKKMVLPFSFFPFKRSAKTTDSLRRVVESFG